MSILLAAALTAAMSSPVEPQQQRVAPRGGYAQSCSEAYVNQGRLYADCRDTRGQMRGTSIELARCGNEDINNDNGLLVCGRFRGEYEGNQPGRPGNSGPGWGGGNGGGWGRSSITVYENANFRGASREFVGEDRNLGRTPFNDRISSVRVQGRWEVCTDAEFRGRCRIVEGDVRNLNGGFNDSISSMRPVRGGR
ncbi:MAG: beta/gamma crystallin-related protein [Brevundimonas sp.]|uniref:beta/gamma crystallin-related protein n=1 Tax=Brevundimonas sp. TaxID=1871086 RepID=UPI00272133D7|nr:beta/gamma crystallin-related protein [Brevundimonas sp.]MDO9610122.1 beta/gamma crystallin-related protein [Brevundimonas sp.]